MADKRIITGIVVDESTKITFIEICERYNIPKKDLSELVDHGVIEADGQNIEKTQFDYLTLERIFSALRLKQDLGVNAPGIALALDLLDKIENIEKEMAILKRQLEAGSDK